MKIKDTGNSAFLFNQPPGVELIKYNPDTRTVTIHLDSIDEAYNKKRIGREDDLLSRIKELKDTIMTLFKII